jgi:DNA-directed RNA polymerase subunit RPC12/RpoP
MTDQAYSCHACGQRVSLFTESPDRTAYQCNCGSRATVALPPPCRGNHDWSSEPNWRTCRSCSLRESTRDPSGAAGW